MQSFHEQEEEAWDKLEEDLRDILEDPQLLAQYKTGLIKESLLYVKSSLYHVAKTETK